ncbi:type II toxin-antitoxin system RelE/ParE family toxin [uncultured Sphingomonas sp.]|uniref:type II toxin-antitoxin system RelE/ParE family toxin n=1 Tax=uncultured Sphingomonas sp. TaxID=158754 RepID=UPI0035CA4B55
MAEVIWTRAALLRLRSIRAYIAQFNPNAAERIAERLWNAGESLKQFSERGRPADDVRRELVIVPPYIIRYRVEKDRVFILGIRHGAQRPERG